MAKGLLMGSFVGCNGNKQGKREVESVCPQKFSDVENIVKKMQKSQGTIIDFEGVPPHIAQRMLDFLSGAVFALEGTINKLKYKKYIIIPNGVKINTIKG